MPKKQAEEKDLLEELRTQYEQQLQDLQTQLNKTKKLLDDQQEISKRAQSDYLRLKLDMDAYVSRTEAGKQEMKIEGLLSIAKKLLPSVYQFKLMVDTCPEELKTNKRSEGVTMLYSKLSKELEILHIYPIETALGSEPNLTYHAPMGTEEVSDKQLQGKIVRELGQGYIYRHEGEEKVIIPATVLVGA